MAIHSLAPTQSNTRASEKTLPRTRKLEIVPESKITSRADRKSFVLFLSVVAVSGLLALLAINTLLAQDAFQLSRLQTQATALNDQREAVMKKIAAASSPGQLARRAKEQGMVPSQSPRFLTVKSQSTFGNK